MTLAFHGDYNIVTGQTMCNDMQVIFGHEQSCLMSLEILLMLQILQDPMCHLCGEAHSKSCFWSDWWRCTVLGKDKSFSPGTTLRSAENPLCSARISFHFVLFIHLDLKPPVTQNLHVVTVVTHHWSTESCSVSYLLKYNCEEHWWLFTSTPALGC